LAYYHILLDDWYLSRSESASRAKEAASKALTIDGSNAEAHLALAMGLHWYEWDWTAAERKFKRAVALNPRYSDASVLVVPDRHRAKGRGNRHGGGGTA
jgi:Tfp pilus assembly protein PilF